jgi:hypothetical protein
VGGELDSVLGWPPVSFLRCERALLLKDGGLDWKKVDQKFLLVKNVFSKF